MANRLNLPRKETVQQDMKAASQSTPERMATPIQRNWEIPWYCGTYHAYLKEGAIPIITLKKCLIVDKLLEQEVIVPLTEPSDYMSSPAFSWKVDNEIRMCLYPSYLNKAIKQDHCWMSIAEEISHGLASCTKFVKVDRSSSYHYIVLHCESPLLKPFNTDKGGFHFI